MNKKEAVLISAYTGFLLTKDFSDVQSFCQNLLGRPIYTHEFARAEVQNEIEEKCKPLILEMVEKEQESADLVSVVRCKYCKNRFQDEDYADGKPFCGRTSEFCNDDDFCSYGERK